FMYLSTCNRVEFLLITSEELRFDFVQSFLKSACRDAGADTNAIARHAVVYEGMKAVEHIFRLTSSLDSLVVGEREIITQVRTSYEQCRQLNLTGDKLRLLIEKAIKTAKIIYSKTDIARNPVSVSSLAFREIGSSVCPPDARVLFVGAGKTVSAMAKMFKKSGYENLHFFNRSLKNAKALAVRVEGNAHRLEDLNSYNKGFDVLVSCTGSADTVISKEIYQGLLGGEEDKKTLVDLAVPADIDESISASFNVCMINIAVLEPIARRNLSKRKKELKNCQEIIAERLRLFSATLRQRQLEINMQGIPKSIKKISEKAVTEVFSDEIDKLDPEARTVLDKILSYIEAKSIAVPMKMARDIMAVTE
ncbi:MAG: glutamyl-tRNA reductase, partial [Flavobacteriales bacterium]